MNVSPSKIRDYLTCPYYFEQKHILHKVPFTPNPHLSFGTSLHKALERILDPANRVRQQEPSEILSSVWSAEGYESEVQSKHYLVEGNRSLALFLNEYEDYWHEILGTEMFLSNRVRFSTTLTAALSCKIDLLHVRTDGVLEVIDFKTNGSGALMGEEQLACDLPTFLYYLLARVNYPEFESIEIVNINLLSLNTSRAIYSATELQVIRMGLMEFLAGIQLEAFKPIKNYYCVFCPIQKTCPVFESEIAIETIFGVAPYG